MKTKEWKKPSVEEIEKGVFTGRILEFLSDAPISPKYYSDAIPGLLEEDLSLPLCSTSSRLNKSVLSVLRMAVREWLDRNGFLKSTGCSGGC